MQILCQSITNHQSIFQRCVIGTHWKGFCREPDNKQLHLKWLLSLYSQGKLWKNMLDFLSNIWQFLGSLITPQYIFQMRYFFHEKSLAMGICWFIFNITCSLNKYNQVISSTSLQGHIKTSCHVLKGIWISFFCSVLFHPWQSHIVRWSQKEPIVQRVMNLELIFPLPWIMLVWKSDTLNPA